MSSDPFDSPRAPSHAASQPGYRHDDTLGRVTGILTIVFGGLELAFSLLAVVGTIMGIAMTVAPPPDPGAEFMGPMLLGVYAVLFLAAVTAGSLHIVGGIQLLRPVPNRAWVWAAAAGSIGSLATIYCSVFGLVSAILLLVWLTRPAPDPDILT